MTSTAEQRAASDHVPTQGLVAFLAAANLPLALAVVFPPRVQVSVGAGDLLRVLPAFGLFLGSGWALTTLAWRSRLATRLYLQAFALRTLVALLLAFTFQFDDEGALHESAIQGVGGGYARLVGFLYHLFGANLLVAKALNVLVGSLLVAVVACTPTSRSTQRSAGRLALVAPPLVILSAVNLKEISTAFVAFLLFRAFLLSAAGRQRTSSTLAVVVLSVGGLWWLRGVAWGVLAALAAAAGLASAFIFCSRLRRGHVAVLATAVAIAFFVLAPSVTRLLVRQYLDPRAGPQASTAYFIDRTFAPQAGVTALLTPGEPTGARNLLVLSLRGLYVPSPLRFIAEPSGSLAVEMAGAIGWLVLLLAGCTGFRRAANDGAAVFLAASGAVVLVATTALVALGADPVRHRAIVVPLLCLLGAESGRPRVRAPVRSVLLASVVGGAVLYNLAYVFVIAHGGFL